MTERGSCCWFLVPRYCTPPEYIFPRNENLRNALSAVIPSERSDKKSYVAPDCVTIGLSPPCHVDRRTMKE